MELEKINEIAEKTFGEEYRVIKVSERGIYMQLALIDNIGVTTCVMDYETDSNCIFNVFTTHSTALANPVTLRALADFIEKVRGKLAWILHQNII